MVVSLMHAKCLVKLFQWWIPDMCLNMIVNNNIMSMQILFPFFFSFRNLGISLNIVINKNIMLLKTFFKKNSFQVLGTCSTCKSSLLSILILFFCCRIDALFKSFDELSSFVLYLSSQLYYYNYMSLIIIN